MSLQEVEETGVPVVPHVMTPWHSVLCFKARKEYGSLVIWDPSSDTYGYPVQVSKQQPGAVFVAFFLL